MLVGPNNSTLVISGMAGGDSPAVDGPLVDTSEPAPGLFAGWVLRPDASGRMGWEAPGLTEADRPEPFDALPDLPAPCPQCGGLTFWWPIVGDRRCAVCHPPTAGIRALERAERIRQQLGIPSPAGAAELLADLRRLVARPEQNRNGPLDGHAALCNNSDT